MSQTWHDDEPAPVRLSRADWMRVGLRGLTLVVLVFGGLCILLVLRMVEAPIWGQRRPITPFITQFVCRTAFVILGIGYHSEGRVMRGPGAVVANHSSWLDVFALNARKRIYFVSKAEVRGWPGIGWLARATGTLFIERNQRQARVQIAQMQARLALGHKLLFFPEGTSTDGRRVLPFKPTLFAAFLDPALREHLQIQPVSVVYRAPSGADPRIYGWWGDMDFAPHLLSTLAARRQGSVTVIYHEPIKVADHSDRKTLALLAETTIRRGLQSAGVAA